MFSVTILSFSGRLRVLALASFSVLVIFSLYNFLDYETPPFPHHSAPAAEPAAAPENIASLKSGSIEPLKSSVEPSTKPYTIETSSIETPTVAASSKALFKKPSLSTIKTSTASKTAAEATATASLTPQAKETLGAIVAAAMNSTDVSWMSELADDWKLFPYTVDEPSPSPEFQIPQNKGHEAMVYLTFIINNWDHLPQRVVFVHGHRSSWHQEGDVVALIRSLRLPALESKGYIPLRCDWYPSCPAEIRPVTHDAVQWGPGVHREDAERGISDAWETLFPGVPMPETIASQCCAQFAVTRASIQRREKADYERMREWILNTTLIDDVSGRVLEKLWAYIMTHDAIHCPPPQQCACDYFGQCGDRDWPTPPEGLLIWPSE